jgi:CPA1 family monovalent cation:H+ antiporter
VEGFEIVLVALLVAVAGLNAVASRVGIPYPIVLVVGGLVLGVLPGLPDVELEPDVVLLIFLPPLLYVAAFFSEPKAMRSYARALGLTSVGLELATVGVVALIGHHVLELPWPMAFALGAIVSPTDPVAATAIMRRLGAPRTVVNLVEGESLLNDAAALVIYRVAVAAAVEGVFSATDAGDALPGRDLIVFITFAVVLVTVVGQGMSLPMLVRKLGIASAGDGGEDEEEQEELMARLAAAKAARAGYLDDAGAR